MPNVTLDELRDKYPPEDQEAYDRAYAAAALAEELAELVYAVRTRAGLNPGRHPAAHLVADLPRLPEHVGQTRCFLASLLGDSPAAGAH